MAAHPHAGGDADRRRGVLRRRTGRSRPHDAAESRVHDVAAQRDPHRCLVAHARARLVDRGARRSAGSPGRRAVGGHPADHGPVLVHQQRQRSPDRRRCGALARARAPRGQFPARHRLSRELRVLRPLRLFLPGRGVRRLEPVRDGGLLGGVAHPVLLQRAGDAGAGTGDPSDGDRPSRSAARRAAAALRRSRGPDPRLAGHVHDRVSREARAGHGHGVPLRPAAVSPVGRGAVRPGRVQWQSAGDGAVRDLGGDSRAAAVRRDVVQHERPGRAAVSDRDLGPPPDHRRRDGRAAPRGTGAARLRGALCRGVPLQSRCLRDRPPEQRPHRRRQ